MSIPGLPQNFDQTNFAEGLWGGPASSPVSNPPQTSFAVPYIVATPVDAIPFTSEVPTGSNVTVTWDFTRLMASGVTISTFVVTPQNALMTLLGTYTSGTKVSALLTNLMLNGQYCSVLCTFMATDGTTNGRYVTLVDYDDGATIII